MAHGVYINKKKFRYISPICREAPCEPICMKFRIWGRVPDVITCDKFFVNRLRRWILQGVEFWHSPLTKAVAVNTVLRYGAPVIMRRHLVEVVRSFLSQLIRVY